MMNATPTATEMSSLAPPDEMAATQPAPVGLSPAFWQLVRTRRSIRRYQARPVPEATLLAVLEAARWASSAHNRQPWRFCIVRTPAARQELSRRMSERWQRDLAADGCDAATIGRRTAISQARLTESPVLIVPALTLEDMDVYSDPQRNQAEYIMAVQSVALACQNLLLAAHDAGLAACWLCAPLFAPDLVREVLDLPDHWQPQAFLTLGYAAEHKEKERAPLAAQVVWR
jgi:coenzyme F420-0:L-glutamate ligase/coenzyme F420-1:gamma-L-glutamate ligase